MAFDEGLAHRIRDVIDGNPDLTEKRMFGGIGFLASGNIACGVLKEDLIVRVGPDAHAAALAHPGARVFDVTGRPMNGWVMVSPDGYEDDAALQSWVDQGLAFARTLPPK
jgi:TfoX/Sxy family transcriptional regulator of competence genes